MINKKPAIEVEVKRAGLDAHGDYFPAAVLQYAVRDEPLVPITSGQLSGGLGVAQLLYKDKAIVAQVRTDTDAAKFLKHGAELAMTGHIEHARIEKVGGPRCIDKMRIIAVGLVAPGAKVPTVEPE